MLLRRCWYILRFFKEWFVEMLLLLVSALLTGGAVLLSGGTAASTPVGCVIVFRDVLLAGRLGEIEECFSFSSAYEYWCDIAASLGHASPDESEFRGMLMSSFSSEEVLEELAAYSPEGFAERRIGSAASVVFLKRGARGTEARAVAAVVAESGVWKVRTYPGVFPGGLLARMGMTGNEGGEGTE